VKSLLVVDRYMPHAGGSRRYYHELARRLGDAAVLTGPQPGGREFDAASGVRTIRRPGIRPNYATPYEALPNPVLRLLLAYLPGMAATIFWLAFELMRSRPAVVHAGGYAFAGTAARLLCPLTGAPWVVYAHGEDVDSTSRRRLFRRLMTWVYLGADAVVVNCHNTGRLVEGLGVPADRIVVAWPGVDDRWFEPGDKDGAAAAAGHADPLVLTVGRLVPHKGHAVVLETLPALLRRWPNLRWIAVGRGPEAARLDARAAELGVAHAVTRLDGVSDELLRGLYARADVFVLPNGNVDGAFEGYGMVFLEAGAGRTAVVGGRDGGVPEAVLDGVTGLLTAPLDVAALTATLTRLLGDTRLRDQLGRGGREQSWSRRWDRTLRAALDLDARLAGRRGAAMARPSA
jgi:phosphatidylinositol alpha-1,6-mannosyltransferase